LANQLTSLELLPPLAAGILPPLVWLWFWLKEDKKRPEPRNLLILSFFAGALSILFVVPLQFVAKDIFSTGLALLVAWAAIEEVAKYITAYIIDFRKRTYDEPIDSMIYLITVALGFASFENVLFLIKSAAAGSLSFSITTALMRFLGATLLHVFSSAFLGGIVALAFCRSSKIKRLYALLGLITATILHTLFNFFIMNDGFGANTSVLTVFAALWVGVIALLLFFERVKTVTCSIKT